MTGAAGIGKTSMVAVARSTAGELGFGVAAGAGSPTESALPFGVFGQAMIALGGSAVDDVAELARLGGQPAGLYRAFHFLADAAQRAPLLLVGEQASAGVREAVEEARLHEDLSSAYRELGRDAYELAQQGALVDPRLAPDIERVRAIERALASERSSTP
ncbi:MAG: hypothetical protein ACRDMJ_17325, partial [Solirubrobacteraceae bacterium]